MKKKFFGKVSKSLSLPQSSAVIESSVIQVSRKYQIIYFRSVLEFVQFLSIIGEYFGSITHGMFSKHAVFLSLSDSSSII